MGKINAPSKCMKYKKGKGYVTLTSNRNPTTHVFLEHLVTKIQPSSIVALDSDWIVLNIEKSEI